MKRLAVPILFLILAICGKTKGQALFGHEWIRTNQKYFRIPIAQTGFYQLTHKELSLAGIPVDSIRLENIQIFRRGLELPVEIEGGIDQQGNAISSIQFYAQKNDGAADSILYVSPPAQPHPFYSLYSDTASYFLTWRVDSLARPMPVTQIPGNGKSIDFYVNEVQELFNAFYSPGYFYPPGSTFDTGITLSSYDVGEGWTGPEIKAGQTFSVSIQTKNLTVDTFAVLGVEMVLVGRSGGSHSVQIISQVASGTSRVLATDNIINYNPKTLHIPISVTDFESDGKLTLTLKVDNGSCSISAVKLQYPSKNTSATALQATYAFTPSMSNQSWNYRHLSKNRLYNCSDLYDVTRVKTTSDSTISLSNISKLISVREFLRVPSLIPVNFNRTVPTNTQFLIISHPLVRQPVATVTDPVAEYASYRSGNGGGNYRTAVVNIEEVYDQFNYGDRSPAGVSNLIKWLTHHGHLKFILLIGRSVDPQSVRKMKDPSAKDMIPNAGWPGSDVTLAMKPGTDPGDFVPLVPIGRINASNAQQVWTYLQKVKAFESNVATARWRKNILHLSGGRSISELGLFKSYVQSYEKKLKNSGMSFTTLSKKKDDPVEQFPLDRYINEGISLMTLFGHSGVNVTDLDIGYASDSLRNYHNAPFFPAVIVNGCATGSIFYTPATISQDWVFAPSAGSVLFLAHTSNGISDALHRYTSSFYEVLADSTFTSEPFGVIQNEAIRRNMQRASLISDFSTAQQMTLHGDPAIRIFPAKYPDYAFDSTQFELTNTFGNLLDSKSDTARVRIGIFNNGRSHNESYKLLFKRIFDNGASDENILTFPAVSNADTVTLLIQRNKSINKEIWKFVLDPKNQIWEENEANNQFEKVIEWPTSGASPLLPKDGFITDKKEIELIATVSEDQLIKTVVFEWDSTSKFHSSQKVLSDVFETFARTTIENPDASTHSLFWRVYVSGDSPDFAPVRKIYITAGASSASLPEAVAVQLTKSAPSIQEGEISTINADFINVTAIPFSDSVQIRIDHSTQFTSTSTFQKIAPLKALEKRTVPIQLPSIGRTGTNNASITFNSNHLPEEIYSNNEVHYTFSVLPDLIRPILWVRVDNRVLTNNENISQKPLLHIGLIDENPFLIREDTVGIEVRIKQDCSSCIEKRVSLKNALTSKSLPNTFFIQTSLEKPLNPGRYILTVKGRDLSGNLAIPYAIDFRIGDTLKIADAGISPVPAHQWIRFYIDLRGEQMPAKWKITVRNISGKIIYQTVRTPHQGKNEMVWQPTNITAGLLLYQMELADSANTPYEHAGNGLTGKLLWIP